MHAKTMTTRNVCPHRISYNNKDNFIFTIYTILNVHIKAEMKRIKMHQQDDAFNVKRIQYFDFSSHFNHLLSWLLFLIFGRKCSLSTKLIVEAKTHSLPALFSLFFLICEFHGERISSCLPFYQYHSSHAHNQCF